MTHMTHLTITGKHQFCYVNNYPALNRLFLLLKIYTMRLLIAAVAALLFSCSSKNDNEFVVEGKIKDAAGVVYLEKTLMDRMQPIIVDSTRTGKDGFFRLAAENTEENLYTLRFGNTPYPFAYLVNDAAYIKVNADLNNEENNYTVSGSNGSSQLKTFLTESNKQLSNIYAFSVQLDSMRNQGHPDSLKNVVRASRKQATDNYRNYVAAFLNENKNPSLIMFALGVYQRYTSNPVLALEPFTDAQVMEVINKTAERFPDHKGIAQLKAAFTDPKQTTVPAPAALLNKPAPDFTLNDVNGKPVSLSSFKGKYVLVDFWASWCGPCRVENPNVVAAYQQFKNKNFTILGVSLDDNKGKWIEAIREDRLTWTHVSDLKQWRSMVVPMYNIEGIPYNVLLDPQGIVIAERLTGAALEQKLAEILK